MGEGGYLEVFVTREFLGYVVYILFSIKIFVNVFWL